MKFKIPASFQLFGQTITVKKVPQMASMNGTIGEARLHANSILLQESVDGFKMHQSQMEQTFFHELVHLLVGFMGQKELMEDEIFVDTFAHLLHQALTTMEYKETK